MRTNLFAPNFTFIGALLLCGVLIVSPFLSGCGILPELPVHTTDLSRYGKWNGNAKEELQRVPGFLPDEETVKEYGVSYEYEYGEPLLGDFHFYIKLTLEGESATQKEIERLCLKEKAGKETDRGVLIYLYENEDSLTRYTDENKYEMPYLFGVVLLEEDEDRITYLVAYVWDYQVPVEPVIDFLN